MAGIDLDSLWQLVAMFNTQSREV